MCSLPAAACQSRPAARRWAPSPCPARRAATPTISVLRRASRRSPTRSSSERQGAHTRMLDTLFGRLGEAPALALAGLLIGVAFGYFAQRSRFCLRAAVIEFARGTREGRLTVWLFAFASAVVLTQAFALVGWFDASGARQISARGSLSGAAIGGALFGIGMILARGCASRLLVLAAHGNLRALLSGLVFAVTALSALSGQLAPLRLAIAQWWTVEGGTSRD